MINKNRNKEDLIRELSRLQQQNQELRAIQNENIQTKEWAETNQIAMDLINSISDGFCALDPELRFTYVNKAAERIIGLPKEAMIGCILGEFFSATPNVLNKYEQVLQEKVTQDYVFFSWPIQKWIEISLYPANNGLSILFRDITERKELELELNKCKTELELKVKERTTELLLANISLENSHQKVHDILESISDAFYAVDADWRLTYINHKTEEWWHRCREDLVGKMLWDIFPNQENIQGYKELHRAAQERIPILFETFSPNLLTWVETSIYPTSDGGLSVYFRDISVRKQMEQELQKSEERFRTAIETMLDCVGIYKAIRNDSGQIEDFMVEYFNEAACRDNKKPKEELEGKRYLDLYPGYKGTELFYDFCEVVETGVPLCRESYIYEDEYHESASRVYDFRHIKMGDGYVAVWRNITERVRINEELQKSRQETEASHQRLVNLKKIAAKSIGIGNIHCFSDRMGLIIQDAYKYHSERSIPVLIQGETGTGKELIAKLIHYGDLDNVDSSFVDLNCAAITPGLFESELFGYEAGSFTGSLNKGQKGKFDLARGGTLFLDEIAEIPLDLQGKLLRVIQEKEFYRVGGLKKIKTDVRIICATNVDLESSVQNGTFRKDLYYRLRVGYINIPPLRERQEEILPFAYVFLRQASELKRKSFKKIGKEAAQILQSYSWPGNVRELKNVIDSIVLMHDYPELKPLHLDMIAQAMANINAKDNVVSIQKPEVMEPMMSPAEEFYLKSNTKDNISLPVIISQVGTFTVSLTQDGFDLDSLIEEIINRALYLNNGNKTETSRYLGISRTALYNRLNKMREKETQ